MTTETFAAGLLRVASVFYGIASTLFAIRVLAVGLSFPLPRSVDPSLSIGPFWLAAGSILQAIVACAFLAAVAESIADSGEPDPEPAPPSAPSDPVVFNPGARAVA